jgi:hypothetical protein
MTKVLIKKWTDEDKREMAQAITETYQNLKKKFKHDIPKLLFTIENLQKAVHTDYALDRIKSISKKGKDLTEQEKRLRRARAIVEGLENSELNLILMTRLDEEIWFQYYLGLYLQKPIFILAKKDIEHEIRTRIAVGGTVKHIEFFEGKDDFEEASDKLITVMKKYGKKELSL